MVSWIDWENTHSVIEYGPGTGVFTDHIVPNLTDSSHFFAIEIDKELFGFFTHRYPYVKIYNDSVLGVEALCLKENMREVDAIVSALPWASFSQENQDALLKATIKVLRPGGQFVTLAYASGSLLPSGRTFARNLQKYFSEVSSSSIMWTSFPPAFFYRCRR